MAGIDIRATEGVAFSPLRRRVLRAGVAAGSLFLPVPYAWVWAQSEGALKLLRLPKLALVVGNNKYKDAPLKNPVNDALALGEALKQSGFEVMVKLDAGRAEMAAAIQAYVQELAKRKCVGLFYYAGHGLQLAWRNYMLPVDADIYTIADIQKQAVEVGGLLEGINRAANPMNVIILDACRDNPLGSLKGVDHKGLSQMDAPLSTLLAYATSPGNTASDGEGANGLYTENLLKEIKVPEAKIEDVFKRVRLGVRRRSNGQQIPWESTSLEEDFYFLPPKELRRISEAEVEKQFDEELAIWEKIKEAKEPGPLEDYLRRYPSGRFSELAQLRLDLVLARQGEKRIEVESQTSNPFTKGTAAAGTDYKVGDSYTYRVTDLLTRLERKQPIETITAITDTQVIYDNGRMTTDFLGNYIRDDRRRLLTASQFFVTKYSVGKKWTTRFVLTRRNETKDDVELDFKVIGKETIAVPAGTFEAWKVEGQGYVRAGAYWKYVYWIAPDKVRRFVAMEYVNRLRTGKLQANDRYDLLSFKQS